MAHLSLAIVIFVVLPLGYAQDDLLVCKPARNLFSGGASTPDDLRLSQGPSGKRGPKGDQGSTGQRGLKGVKGDPGNVNHNHIEQLIQERIRTFSNCSDIKRQKSDPRNGLYDIEDAEGSVYRTYCDMETDDGGWTLVASIHENFIKGRCTAGDRWSSEHGNNAAHPHGDGAWENTAIFGAPESATSDDYKNPGYFNLKARDVMIWHVPNRTPVKEYKSRAFMMYHTANGFLSNYGGNLYYLFGEHYPLRSGTYVKTTDNGPSPPIVWDRGNNALMVQNTAPNARPEITAGFIQFRAINHERGAFAICPGVQVKPSKGNVEHYCLGGTSNQGSAIYCGDFSAYDYSGYATGTGWSSNRAMTESVVMIFYR